MKTRLTAVLVLGAGVLLGSLAAGTNFGRSREAAARSDIRTSALNRPGLMAGHPGPNHSGGKPCLLNGETGLPTELPEKPPCCPADLRNQVPVAQNVQQVSLLAAAKQRRAGERSSLSRAEKIVPVTVSNYVRAETDLQFKGYAEKFQAFGKFAHGRQHYPIDNQVTHSGNRDTIYSFGVFDLGKSPLTVTLPDPQGRYMSLMLISEDHDIYPAMYAPGTYGFSKELIGTRYIMLGIRTFADPNDPKDMKKAHALQDAVNVQQADAGKLVVPHWDEEQVLKLRKAANVLGSSVPDSSRFFGVKGERSYLENMMGVAVGWGGLQRRDALYIPVTPANNDGKTPYVLDVPADVPVDGFWSVTVYNKDRFMVKNKYNAYSFNNVTATKNTDGSITIHFGGDPKQSNFLPIVPGWQYLVRLYRPRKEILDGKWKFPAPKPAQ